MTKLIDVGVLVDFIDGSQRLDTEHDYEEVARYLEECPAVDAVPVCRCKDCELWNDWDSAGKESLGNYVCSCAHWSVEDGAILYTRPTDYCSYGERKDGGDNGE